MGPQCSRQDPGHESHHADIRCKERPQPPRVLLPVVLQVYVLECSQARDDQIIATSDHDPQGQPEEVRVVPSTRTFTVDPRTHRFAFLLYLDGDVYFSNQCCRCENASDGMFPVSIDEFENSLQPTTARRFARTLTEVVFSIATHSLDYQKSRESKKKKKA